jgi:lysozyme
MIIINNKCIELIKSFEGLSLKAYHDSIDPAGIDTIGYGTIIYPPTYLGGKKVRVGDPNITKEQAIAFLKWEVELKTKFIDILLRDDLTVNQFGALVSFAYNLGEGALKGSTLRKKINIDPHDPTIHDEFIKWDMADGHHLGGLKRRRQAESDLYFTK